MNGPGAALFQSLLFVDGTPFPRGSKVESNTAFARTTLTQTTTDNSRKRTHDYQIIQNTFSDAFIT